jgi:hypothetical protein
MANYLPEIFVEQVRQALFPSTSFLANAKDYSGFASGAKLHIPSMKKAHAQSIDQTGNYTGASFDVASLEDNELAMAEYFSRPTLLRSVERETLENSVDLLENYSRLHSNQLMADIAADAAQVFSPADDNDAQGVLEASGDGTENTGDRLALSPDDIIQLKFLFDAADVPLEGRALALTPQHAADLLKANVDAFKDLGGTLQDGQLSTFAGFTLYIYSGGESGGAVYDLATKARQAKGTHPDGTNTRQGSFAFARIDTFSTPNVTPYFHQEATALNYGEYISLSLHALSGRTTPDPVGIAALISKDKA